jgi:hypothetical protein
MMARRSRWRAIVASCLCAALAAYLLGYYLCRRNHLLIRFHSYWGGGTAGVVGGDNQIVAGGSLENNSGSIENTAYYVFYPLCTIERWCRGPGPTFKRSYH